MVQSWKRRERVLYRAVNVPLQNHWGNYDACKGGNVTANTSAFNKAKWYNITTNPGFAGFSGAPSSTDDDYALLPTSRIYTTNPNFKSCPRSAVGPTTVSPGTILPLYLTYWNMAPPAQYWDMMNFPFSQILNQGLTIPVSNFTINQDSTTVPN